MSSHTLSPFDFLVQSIQSSNDKAFLNLFNSGPEQKYIKLQCKEKGWTLLHHAAYMGRVELIEFLVSKGAVINQVCFGETSLTCAIKRDKTDAAMALINLGCDVDFCSYSYPDIKLKSDIQHALMKVGRQLIEDVGQAQKYTMAQVAQEMIRKGASLNATQEDTTHSAMATAIMYENWEALDLILNASQFDINGAINNKKSTALTFLAHRDEFEQFQKFIIKGANPNVVDEDGLNTIDVCRKIYGPANEYELFINSYKEKNALDSNLLLDTSSKNKETWKV